MKRLGETVGQSWIHQLSLVAIDKTNVAEYQAAQHALLAINPLLGMDGKALHFAVQGWLAAQRQPVAAG